MLSRIIHAVFYLLLIGLPIGGWLAGSYFGMAIDYFGLFEIPPLPVAENADAGKAIIGQHQQGGKIMLVLIALHILGALKHTLVDKNGLLWRILPFGTPKG